MKTIIFALLTVWLIVVVRTVVVVLTIHVCPDWHVPAHRNDLLWSAERKKTKKKETVAGVLCSLYLGMGFLERLARHGHTNERVCVCVSVSVSHEPHEAASCFSKKENCRKILSMAETDISHISKRVKANNS